MADRDYPPFHRSIRDGFAVRAEDVAAPPVELLSRGEIRAGGHFTGAIGAGECVSIMTGAPLPAGADAVVMVEYTESHDDRVKIQRGVRAGENVVQQGSEVHAGACVMPRGCRLGAGELGLLATVGKSRVPVFVRPARSSIPAFPRARSSMATPATVSARAASHAGPTSVGQRRQRGPPAGADGLQRGVRHRAVLGRTRPRPQGAGQGSGPGERRNGRHARPRHQDPVVDARIRRRLQEGFPERKLADHLRQFRQGGRGVRGDADHARRAVRPIPRRRRQCAHRAAESRARAVHG